MRLPQHYDSGPLVAAITALDWSQDAAAGAAKIIQTTVQERFGESLPTAEAVWLLGSLLNRRLIRMQTHPDDAHKHVPDRTLRRAKYVRVPPADHTSH